jgi:hypothetical protein
MPHSHEVVHVHRVPHVEAPETEPVDFRVDGRVVDDHKHAVLSVSFDFTGETHGHVHRLPATGEGLTGVPEYGSFHEGGAR